ncbi:hypothetical protein B484DRAFT_481137, partial [Ochromonadaceae sp. CCMP2298]
MTAHLPAMAFSEAAFLEDENAYAGALERQGAGMALAHLDALGSHPTINGGLGGSGGIPSATNTSTGSSKGSSKGSTKGKGYFTKKIKSTLVRQPAIHMRVARSQLVYPPGFPRPSAEELAAQEAEDEEGGMCGTGTSSPHSPRSPAHSTNKRPSNDVNLVDDRMAGGLALSRRESGTYFGAAARREFFERARWLQTQRQYGGTRAAEATERLAFPDSFEGAAEEEEEEWQGQGTGQLKEKGRKKGGIRTTAQHLLAGVGGFTLSQHDKERAKGRGGLGGREREKEGEKEGEKERVKMGKGEVGWADQTPTGGGERARRREGKGKGVGVGGEGEGGEKGGEKGVSYTVTEKFPRSRRGTMEAERRGFAFAPTRSGPTLIVTTKVIIRTQSLLQGDAYEQLKLVPQPDHLLIDGREEGV